MDMPQESKIRAIKKPGTSGIQGQYYEIELVLHFLLKGFAAKQENKINQFYLASNLNYVHGFDDLIFKYVHNHNSEKIEKIILLQAKHREKEDEKITLKKILANVTTKGEFSIKYYFDCFNETNSSFVTTEDFVLKDSIENCEFILFSNALLDKEELSSCLYDVDNCEFFDWNNQKRLKFKCTTDIVNLLKRPLHLDKLLQEMFEWIKTKKIYKKKNIYLKYCEFIQETIIDIHGKISSFRNEFLFPTQNDTLILQKEFFNQLVLKKMTVWDIKEIKFTVVDGWKATVDDPQEIKFVSEWSESEIKTFLERFTLMFDQPNVEELKSLNKKLLQSHLCLSPDEAHLYHVQLHEKICRWWLKVEFYLTEEDEHFSELENDLLFIKKYNESSYNFEQLDLKFQNVNFLIDHLTKNNLIFFVTNNLTKIQLHAKVYQTLNEMKLDYMFFDANTFFKLQTTIMEKFKLKYNIIVITDVTVNNSKSLPTELFKIVNENNDRKLILMGDYVETSYNFKILEDVEIKFSNLTDESQEQFLNKIIIHFHGKYVTLKRVIQSNSAMDCEMFAYLITNKNITINLKNLDFSQIESYHVPRKLARHEFLNKQCLQDDRFALVLEEPYGDDIHRNIFSENDIPVEYEKHSIHYVKQERSKLLWLKSAKNVKDIREYITDELSLPKTPEELLKQECQFVIIAGEPGMGKSCLISYIMSQIETEYWMYRVNLATHSCHFENKNHLDPLEFLKLACLMDNFEFKLFKNIIEHHGNIILFFDGFDEICPYYKEQVLLLFNKLRNMNIKKIWITTRFIAKEDLENHINTLSFELLPFTPADQENFLKSFKKMDNQTVKTFLGKFSNMIDDQMRKFVSIPLQLRMLVEIYEDYNFKEFNLYKIYRCFFEKKIREILYEEKMEINPKHSVCIREISKSIESSIKRYEQWATLSLFEKQLSSTLTEEKIMKIKRLIDEEVINGKDKSGIVNNVQNGKAVFVHKTFAEYFSASYLIRKFKKNESINEFMDSIGFFEPSQSVLRKFFDYGLCENQKLCTAVLSNDLLKLGELEYCGEVSEIDEGGRTPLHLAAAYGLRDIAEYLLKNGADVQAKDLIMQWTPISYGDACQHLAILEILLGLGGQPNCMYNIVEFLKHPETEINIFKNSIATNQYVNLMKFVYMELNIKESEKDEVVKSSICSVLYKYISPRKKKLKKMLHIAIAAGDHNMVIFLIKNGADPMTEHTNGETSLHVAALFGHIAILKYFVEITTSSFDIKNRTGQTILHRAAIGGNIDTIKYLIENGADPMATDDNRDTPLHDAAMFGHFAALKTLLDVTENSIGIKNDRSQTILHRAAIGKKIKSIKYLIENGADPLAIDENGDTPLHYAAQFGHITVLKYLMDNTQNSIIIKNNQDQTILHSAALGGNMDAIKFLIENGADPLTTDVDRCSTSLHSTTYNEHLTVMQQLIPINSCWINLTTKRNQTLLHNAVSSGKIDLIQYLIQHGANPLAVDEDGDSPIQYAAENGHISVLEYLLSITSNTIYLTNEKGETLLHHAIMFGNMDMVKYLLAKGLDPSATDNIGNTILHFGAGFGDIKNFEYLLTLTPWSINIRNKRNQTPLDRAVNEKKIEMIEYLSVKEAALIKHCILC